MAKPKFSLAGLKKALSDDEIVREQFCAKGTLWSWPCPKQTGIINFTSISQNSRILHHLIDIWCPQLEVAKTLPVPPARKEALGLVSLLVLKKPGRSVLSEPYVSISSPDRWLH